MMVHPVRAGPGWWLAGDADPALVATLRYAPALIFCPVPSLVAPADPWGDPDDRRVPVLTPAAWAATPPPWPVDRPLAVARQVDTDDPWPAPDPTVRWWVVSPARWAAAQAAAPLGVACLATGPVPGPHIDPTGWPLGRWLALARPFADDEEESA